MLIDTVVKLRDGADLLEKLAGLFL